MTYIKILPPNTNLCLKNHKFRMKWLKNKSFAHARVEGASKIIF